MLGSQGIVVKCTAAIIFPTVDSRYVGCPTSEDLLEAVEIFPAVAKSVQLRKTKICNSVKTTMVE